jgi:cation diffusion facilitator family transporter
MDSQVLDNWQHDHLYTADSKRNEHNVKLVIVLTFIMMIFEVGAGYLFGSMALLADGWHMGTHVAALSITAFAYMYARRHQDDPNFCFGTGKVSTLGGFASSIALAMVAFLMVIQSAERFFSQGAIQLDQALDVAVIGLVVNLFSALLLNGHSHGDRDHHDHAHDASEKGSGNHAEHSDQNLKAAYLHVVADALTSLLAIIALLAGIFLGWLWMDTVMGFVGAAVILWWSYNLIRETSKVLLDFRADEELIARIRSTIEAEADNRISDLHVWQISPGQWAALIAFVTHDPKPVNHYKTLLAGYDLAHVSLEVNLAPHTSCMTNDLSNGHNG